MSIIVHKNIFFRYWLPVLLIGGIIFYSSSTPYSDQDIKPQLSQMHIIYQLVGKLDSIHFTYVGKEISIDKLGVAGFTEFFIRKLSHLSVFLLLAFFTTRLISLYTKKYFILGLSLTIIYAALDEFHQSFTADRTPLVQDVIIDSCGAIIGACIFLLFYKKYKKKYQN